MGQRTPTETLIQIVSAFVQQSTWRQADLGRELDVTVETVRKKLTEMQSAGFTIEREEDHPHVYWSVPKNWFPGALAFTETEAKDLVRLVLRAPEGELRDRVLAVFEARLTGNTLADRSVGPPVEGPEESVLAVIEDACRDRVALKMRYFAASRGDESERHVSVHRIEGTPKLQFIATCHRSNGLKRFRVSNVSAAKLDPRESLRAVDAAALERFAAESVGGFRADGEPVRCVFVVHGADAAWVARNLPDPRIVKETTAGGSRFSIETSAVLLIARFVVGLGRSATTETPELTAAVSDLARGALGL